MAQDMGLDMMFVVNCGLTCQGRPGEMIPMEDLSEWVQDMLDAIEYANGPVTGYWGSLRAKNGHPEPFGLKYLEIGNENFGPEYNLRYRVFYEAVKEKYPEVVTILGGTKNTPRSSDRGVSTLSRSKNISYPRYKRLPSPKQGFDEESLHLLILISGYWNPVIARCFLPPTDRAASASRQ